MTPRAGSCWSSDPAFTAAGSWIQFDFASPRYVDMIQLFPFNALHGGASARSFSYAEVQVPNGTSGEWVTVGEMRLPPSNVSEGDAGINLRATGLPSYFVPAR